MIINAIDNVLVRINKDKFLPESKASPANKQDKVSYYKAAFYPA